MDVTLMSEIESAPIAPSRYTRCILARQLRGAAALAEALELIGANNATDRDLACVIIDNELELREMLAAVLAIAGRQSGEKI